MPTVPAEALALPMSCHLYPLSKWPLTLVLHQNHRGAFRKLMCMTHPGQILLYQNTEEGRGFFFFTQINIIQKGLQSLAFYSS